MRKLVFIPLIVALCLTACEKSRKRLSPKQYITWAKSSEKDLVKKKEINGYKFISKFQPAELLILKNMDESFTQASVDSLKNIQYGIFNFVMDIGSAIDNQSLLRANISDENEYYQRVYYYTKEVQNDLYVVEGKDTLPCIFYHFEQTYNLSPVNSLVMEFQRKNPDTEYENVSLIYEDRMLNTGIIKFQYKKSFLNNLPQLSML
jgi:hypothetical protein